MKLNDALGGLLTYKLAGEDAVRAGAVWEGLQLRRAATASGNAPSG